MIDDVIQPSDAEVIFAAVERKLRGVHTALPGQVVAYDPLTQTATIQIVVQVEIARGQYVDLPPLQEVTVAQPLTATHYLHLPITSGDHCVVIFYEQDPSEWLTKGTSTPAILRRHGFYPVAYLGARLPAQCLTASEAPAGMAALGARAPGACVGVSAASVLLGSLVATDPVVLESKLRTAFASACTAAGAVATPAAGAPMMPVFQAFAGAISSALLGALKVKGE